MTSLFKLFKYNNETFGLWIIYSNFLKIFNLSTFEEQDIFLKYLGIDKKSILTSYLEKEIKIHKPSDTDSFKILKQIRKENLQDNTKEFDSYYMPNLFYKLPNNIEYSEELATLILKFTIRFLKFETQLNDHSRLIRFFIHYIEIAIILEQNRASYSEISNILSKPYPESIAEAIKSEILIATVHNKSKDSSYVINIANTSIKLPIYSNVIVKDIDIKQELSSFLYFLKDDKKRKEPNLRETTSLNQKEYDQSKYRTFTRYDDFNIDFSDDVRENANSCKEQIQVKIDEQANTKTRQTKQILAISASIAKNKLQLPSLYSIPSIESLKVFLGHLILTFKMDSVSEETVNGMVLLMSIVMGYNPEDLIKMLQNKKFKIDEDTISLSIDEKKFFAKYLKFNEQIGIKTDKKFYVRLPFNVIKLIGVVINANIKFSLENFKLYLRKDLKSSPKTINISYSKIWQCSQIHRRLFYKSIDSEILLASTKIDKNATPLLAYTAMSNHFEEYSSWLYEYMDILNINEKLNKQDSNYKTSQDNPYQNYIDSTIESTMIGSKKLLQKNVIVEFFKELKKLFNMQNISRNDRFNLYSIYVRYAMTILLGTRDFGKSVDISRIKFSKDVIVFKEKGHFVNSGYRVVPLCNLAKNILQNYLNVLRQRNLPIKAIVVLNGGKYVEATLANIKQTCEGFSFFERKRTFFEMIEQFPLNEGRHLMVTMATQAGIDKDDIHAFMGHAINGGELLGINSFHDVKQYKEKFLHVSDQIGKIYNIKDIYDDRIR